MRKFSAILVALVLGLGVMQPGMAADAVKTRQASCKEEAKQAGIADKKAIRDFVKQCKKDRKAAKAK